MCTKSILNLLLSRTERQVDQAADYVSPLPLPTENSPASSSSSLKSYRKLLGDATVGLNEDSEFDSESDDENPGFRSSQSTDSLAFDQTQIGVSQWLREVEAATGTLRARNPDPASASPSQDLPSDSYNGNQSRWSHSTDSLAREGPPNDFSFWDLETESETGSPTSTSTSQSLSSSSSSSTQGEAAGDLDGEDVREPPQVDPVTFALLWSRDDSILVRLRGGGEKPPHFHTPTPAMLSPRATWYVDEIETARSVEVYGFGPGDATVVDSGATLEWCNLGGCRGSC
ncbi:hypothetical protein BDP81DRAFT_439189 [Colletotrichum phormii]|uniref:Uncharacterized protein n=1 Tax=Colletotrichum phormii TaxID=359342 RepID=A0AAI9ZFJ0_9PEZI|nr:uncharacterized protein BDP81DRAFT_439189 [Colletotrichum phormii]KAK1623618.1 hypothetical protein BDP81DRAFT_439189 [Colletotrichum phormii]